MPRTPQSKSAPALHSGPPRRLPPVLRRAWYGLNQAFRRRVAHLGITPDQYSILRWLKEGDRRGLTQREITDLMAADANTVAAILGRMEKSGLIDREVHEADRRAHRVQLTGAGRKKFSTARRVATKLQGEILSVLPPDQLCLFMEQLETVATACQQAVDATRKSG